MCKYFAVVLFLQSLTPLFSRIIEFLSTFTFVECQLGQRTDTKKIAASNYICSPLNQYEYISSFQINTIKRHRRSFKLIRNKLNLNIQKPLDVLTSQKNICNHKLILSAWKIYWDIYCFKGFIYRTQSDFYKKELIIFENSISFEMRQGCSSDHLDCPLFVQKEALRSRRGRNSFIVFIILIYKVISNYITDFNK